MQYAACVLGLVWGLLGAGTAGAAAPAAPKEVVDAALSHPWLFLLPQRSPEAYFTNMPNPATTIC